MKNGDIINEEHSHRLGDEDLIEAICEALGITKAEFDTKSETEQRQLQLDWVSP